MRAEYPYTAQDLADEFGVTVKTMQKHLRDLELGAGFGGRLGYRYSEDDRLALIESLRRGVAS